MFSQNYHCLLLYTTLFLAKEGGGREETREKKERETVRERKREVSSEREVAARKRTIERGVRGGGERR